MAQEVKNDIKKALQVNTIPLIAIMTAVTTVLTMLVKIPTPIRGYLNLSDTMIYFSAYAFGPWVGGLIGGLGPALSDLISGRTPAIPFDDLCAARYRSGYTPSRQQHLHGAHN